MLKNQTLSQGVVVCLRYRPKCPGPAPAAAGGPAFLLERHVIMLPSLWNALTWAAAAPATGAAAAGAADKPAGLNPMILMFTVIIILFYL